MGDQHSSQIAAVTIEKLFRPKPRQWGLRGDRYLWAEMAKAFARVPLPESPDRLRRQFRGMYRALTGHSLLEDEPFYVERFAKGGMSSGHICPEFWRERGVPLLVERFLLLQREQLGRGIVRSSAPHE